LKEWLDSGLKNIIV